MRRSLPGASLRASDDGEELALARIVEARYEGLEKEALARRFTPGTNVGVLLDALVGKRAAVRAGAAYFAAPLCAEAKKAVLEAVMAFHRERPMGTGISTAELVTRMPIRLRPLLDPALSELLADRALTIEQGSVRSVDRSSASSARDEACARVLARFERDGLAPPLDDVVRRELGLAPASFAEVLRELSRRDALRLVGGMHFVAEHLEALKGTVAGHFALRPSLTPPEFKSMTNLSRKHAIALLEWLDGQGVTQRKGEHRVAGPALTRRAAEAAKTKAPGG